MEGTTVRATRTTVMTAILLSVLMLGLPAFVTNNAGPGISAVGEVVATGEGDRVLKVGWPGLKDDIQTLNPLAYTMGAEFVVIWPCYSTVVTYDIDNNLIGDLATSVELLPDGLTWRIKIVDSAYFYNKFETTQVRVTVEDIKYTFWMIQETPKNYLQYFFPEIPGTDGRLMESITTNGDFEMDIKLRIRYAPFLSGLTTIPILPKYIWEGKDWKWDNYILGEIPPIVGSGFLYYGLNEEPSDLTCPMYPNPYWHGTTEYGWDLHVDEILLKSETEDSNLADYLAGNIDIMTWPTSTQYLNPSLPGQKWTSSQGFVFEFNMNQLSVEDRIFYDIGGPSDFNSQLLLDPVIKLALMMSIDKQKIVDSSIGGLGAPADSLMPSVSPWYYDYGGPEAPEGEEEVPYDPAAAWELLYDNGWRYRLDGSEILPGDDHYQDYYPLSKLIGGVVSDTLEFRYVTPATDSFFEEGAILIQEDAALSGVSLLYSDEPTGVMNDLWYDADYDTWYWDWWFVPNSEPSVDVMQVLATEAIGSWSDVYWSNATYDEIYYESLSEMNPEERALLIDELQRMAYEESGCFPVAYMDMLYAARSVAPEYWQNWGDWNAKYPLTVDSGYPWLFTVIEPADNPAPKITGWSSTYESTTTVAVPLTGTAVDDDPLEYRWNFGDGTKSEWFTAPSPAMDHLYTVDGTYEAWLMVREDGTLDQFMTSKRTTVSIIDITNSPPHDQAISFEPIDPDSGTMVSFTGFAIDDDPGDVLTYTWDFGDGGVAMGQYPTHQFSEGEPSYTVTMYVDDGHVSHPGGVRPVSTTRLVTVTENTAPTIVAQDEPFVEKKEPFEFRAYAYDPDVRDTLRFTWDWGDHSDPSVTSTDTAWHTYTQGTYTLTVWCDDLTGLEGHNQSDTATINVGPPPSYAPVIEAFYVSNEMPAVEETVTFYGTVTDQDNDLCTYTWDFGDMNTDTSVQTEVNSTLSIEHTYMSEGLVLAYLTVTDGLVTVEVMDPLIIYVLPPANVPPEVDPLPEVHATVDVPQEFTATATDDDGDPLTYTWDFHDGTPLQVGNPVMHTYEVVSGEFGMLYTVYVDDGYGGTHNVSVNGIAFVVLPMVTLDLVAGWNLVTIPFADSEYTANTLGLGFEDIIYGYNPTMGFYDQMFIVGVFPPEADFALEPLVGYWVYANSPVTLELEGRVDAAVRAIDVPTSGGWALVGVPSGLDGIMASELVAMYSGTVDAVFAWNPTLGFYDQFYVPGVPELDFEITPGMGLWMHCLTDGDLSYVP